MDILIPDKFISKIQLHDKKLSTITSILLVIAIVGGLFYALASNVSPTLNWSGGLK